MVRSSVRLIVRSFVRSFVQIIFFLPLCYRNSDRSFVRSFDRSSFVHSSYSSFIVRSSSLFTVHRSFIRTIHHHYSSLLFIDHPITPNFNYSSIMLSSPPKTSQTHIPVIRTSVTDFHSSRELPIWSPILDFSKLSTLNFGILSSQTSKKKGEPCLYGYVFNPIKPGPRYHSPLGPEYHSIPAIWVPPHCCLM
jgi:hypothetical protein